MSLLKGASRSRSRVIGLTNAPYIIRTQAPGGSPSYSQYYHPWIGEKEEMYEERVSQRNTAIRHTKAKNSYKKFNFWYHFDVEYENIIIPDAPLSVFPLDQAIRTMKPQLKSDFSVLNFIYELKDFRELPKQLISASGKVLDILKGTDVLGNLARVASEGLLLDSFAIEPLIGDIFTFIESYNTFLIKYDKLKKEAKKPLKRSVRKQFSIDAPADVVLYETWNTWFTLYQHNSYTTQDVNWTIYYSYTLPDLPPIPAIFLKYIGIRMDPRIIWNAIPFSFVIDWLLQISDWLEQWDAETFPINLSISEATCSWKGKVYTAVKHVKHASAGETNLPDETLGFVGSLEYYIRNVVTQKEILHRSLSYALPEFGSPGTKQMLLSLALLTTMSK